MKKNIGQLLLVILSAFLIASCQESQSSSSFASSSAESSLSSSTETTSSSTTSVSESSVQSAYYKTVDWTESGDALKKSLATLLTTTSKTMPGYGGLKTYLPKCDLDPNGSGKMLGFYDETKLNDYWDYDTECTWNREHVWPNSRGGSVAEGDPHMIRPAAISTNEDRGNSMYAESGAYDPGQFLAKYRGIAARIILYTATRYWSSGLSLSENTSDASSKKTMGKLSDLLKWNLEYSIDITETHRNDTIYGDYNVRNPFIDHPEAACKIWGDTDSATRGVCKISA